MALSVLNILLNAIETINRPREKCASALNGLIYFFEKIEDASSIIYLWIIKNPANSEAIIVNDSVLKKYIHKTTDIRAKITEKDVGPAKNFIFTVLCHFESIEKNKNIEAITTIGMKIAL